MTRRPNALRIGLFAIVGLVVLITAVVAVSGGKLFANTERAELNFQGSIYGLQKGAPVVFRGVRIGSVVNIGVVHDESNGSFTAPVLIEIDRHMFRQQNQANVSDDKVLTIAALVQKGLRAQLLTQSLLTGQLYVDLDIVPKMAKAAVAVAQATAQATAQVTPQASAVTKATASGLTEIPTAAARQGWQTQLEGMSLPQLGQDLGAIASAARQMLSSPELKKSLAELGQATSSLVRLMDTLDKRLPAMADSGLATLQSARTAATSVQVAIDRAASSVDNASTRVGNAAQRADTLLKADSPLLQSLQQAATELGRSAVALRQATGEDSEVMRNVDGTLQEVRRAARAMRNLADLLERQPEALVRGRTESP